MDDRQLTILGLSLYFGQDETIDPSTGEYNRALGREIYLSFLAEHPDFRPFWEAAYDSAEEENAEVPNIPVLVDDESDEETNSDEEEDSIISDEDFVDVLWIEHGEEDYIDERAIENLLILSDFVVLSLALVHVFDVVCTHVFYQPRFT